MFSQPTITHHRDGTASVRLDAYDLQTVLSAAASQLGQQSLQRFEQYGFNSDRYRFARAQAAWADQLFWELCGDADQVETARATTTREVAEHRERSGSLASR